MPFAKAMMLSAGGKSRHAFARILLALIFPLLVSCSSERETPEAQVRAFLKRGETAAAKKETPVLRQMISGKYADSQGQDKQAIEAVLRYYFLRNKSIYLFTRVQSIGFPEPARAEAVVLVAMAGQPMAGAEDVARLRADLHRFEITLIREDKDWKVVRAEWRRAEPGDFF